MTRPYPDLLAEIRRRTTVAESGCHVYAGTDNGYGYKTISHDYVHRHVHRLLIGPIPDGYEVDHLCFVRACVNPAHLEAVTPEENKRRAFARKLECVNGHPLPEFTSGQNRYCAPCHAARERKRRARIAAGLRPPVPVLEHQHGTQTGYGNGCRCEPCREAQTIVNARWRQQRKTQLRGPRDDQHGTRTGYEYGCRCDLCRESQRLYRRAWRARKAAA